MTPSPAALDAACRSLAEADAALKRAHLTIGRPEWRSAPATYETLARIVTFQQISTVAARAIWDRTRAALGHVTAEAVLAAKAETLQACGQSRPKVRHLASIAEAVTSGALAFERLAAAPIAEARAELLAVSGVGPWTADVFLLSATGALDAFPAGDVGLMAAYQTLAGLEARPTREAFIAIAETWRPHRAVAAHLLWGWLAASRETQLEASPIG